MGKYLYNGVPLPKLPDWDEETYPVAYIWELIGFYYLHIGKAYYYYYDEDGKYKVGLTGYYGSYLAHSSGWGGFNDGKDGELIIGEVENFDALIWTNTPILFEDGTIAEAASTPIPVGTAPEIDPVLMTAGYRLGCIVRAQRARKKEPVAYLYNGVRLPPLPKEWDREKYPYAAIGRIVYSDGSRGIWKFIARETPFIAYDNESGHIIWMISTPIMYDHTTDKPNEWVINTTGIYSALEYLWSNHDVCSYDDGTVVVHKASEPVPIYE